MLLNPHVVPGSVVSHPVEDDADAVLMAGLNQLAQVINSAVLRCHSLIVAHRIGRVLTLLLADGIDGHDPNHVNAQVVYGVDAGGDGLERVGRSEHARIDLIHHHVGDLREDKLIGHRHSMVVTVGLAGHNQHQQCHY